MNRNRWVHHHRNITGKEKRTEKKRRRRRRRKEKKRKEKKRREEERRRRKDKILTLTRGTRHELNKYLYGVLQTAPTPRSSPLQIIWRYLRAPCNKPAARSICRPRYPMGRSEKWKKYETKITFGSRYLCWKKRKKEKNKRNNSVPTCWQSISFHVSLSVKKKTFDAIEHDKRSKRRETEKEEKLLLQITTLVPPFLEPAAPLAVGLTLLQTTLELVATPTNTEELVHSTLGIVILLFCC